MIRLGVNGGKYNLFAKDIGLINANSEFSYQISSTAATAITAAGINLPIPTTDSRTSTETLTDFFIE